MRESYFYVRLCLGVVLSPFGVLFGTFRASFRDVLMAFGVYREVLGVSWGNPSGILGKFLSDKAFKMPPRLPQNSPINPQTCQTPQKDPPGRPEVTKMLTQMSPKGTPKATEQIIKIGNKIFFDFVFITYL